MMTLSGRLATRLAVLLTLSGACCLSAGCIGWSYDRVEIGHGPRDYDRVLPERFTQQTDLGQCYFRETEGRTESILLQLGEDRRVFGKWMATDIAAPNKLRREKAGYELVGRFAPAKIGMGDPGPADILRLVMLDLSEPTPDSRSRTTYAWIAAGVARLAAARQLDGFDALLTPEAKELSSEIAADGRAAIDLQPDGAYEFFYSTREE